MATTTDYRTASHQLISDAASELETGALSQASWKAWEAATSIVSAVAVYKEWDHDDFGGLFQVVTRLSEETDDAELPRLFLGIYSLYQNYYEGWQTTSFVKDGLDDVRNFIHTLDETLRSDDPL